MRPNIVTKKRPVLIKIPETVGAPDGVTKSMNLPKNFCKIRVVSGLANRKKTNAL